MTGDSSAPQMISKYFTWHDALWLPQWKRLANEADGLTDEIKKNLVDTFAKMDIVREWSGGPIVVHCSYRPPKYNDLVKGSKRSMHLLGRAVDFHCEAIGIEEFTKKAVAENPENQNQSMLELWNMRMEKGTQGWIHLDSRQVVQGEPRWFKP